MNSRAKRHWADRLVRLTVHHPWGVIGVVVMGTLVALWLSSRLTMVMNWTDLLPPTDQSVEAYLEVHDRFGAATIVVALEGERDSIVAMAAELEPRLKSIDRMYSVDGKLPVDFFLEHGFVLLKPNDFERALRIYKDPSIIGVLRGINNDYEREYSDSETNLKRDEIEIARSLHGLNHSLDVLYDNLAEDPSAAPVQEAVEALLIGDPWTLSLDRNMLLILCTPISPLTDVENTVKTVEDVQTTIADVAPRHPGVTTALTGMGKISQDELNSLGNYTIVLSILSLILIFILLARSFRGWVTPLIAVIPLVVGIVWTTGTAYILFGSLNLFTIMIMLVLLGLGIDFAIHLISRFYEEHGRGKSVEECVSLMLNDTGRGVVTGALTTAAAFFALMVARTSGVFEFGAAAGAGVVLTLASVLIVLPALLTIRERGNPTHAATKIEDSARNGWPRLGKLGVHIWRQHWLVIGAFVIVGGLSLLGAMHTRFEYDWLNLEPAGLESVALQREIPSRFGVSDHYAWAIAPSVEESRRLKDELRELPGVGNVNAISDVLTIPERLDIYTPQLDEFIEHLKELEPTVFTANELLIEVNRLWDNLDLMSNLAFQSGLDRIVRSIDAITGYNTELDRTDSTAVLPRLVKLGGTAVNPQTALNVAELWRSGMTDALIRMADASPVAIADLPGQFKRLFLPRDGGDGYLVHITPRDYLYDKSALDRFIAQTDLVDPAIVGTPELFVIMIEETLRDGRNGAFLALLVVVVLLLVHFRSAAGLLAIIPLAGGALFMLGVMYLLGMKYNYINLVAVPIILGIGIDDGVHALHRYRAERGTGEQRVSNSLRFVGRAILLTSITTMIGFGSIALYEMRGLASFGVVLLIGVAMCFLTTVFVLPAILRLFTRHNGNNEDQQ